MGISHRIKDIIDAIFSENGYSIQKFNIQFPHPLDIKIVKESDERISLQFTRLFPKISWKKFITLSANVNGIVLDENGGVLKLKYFPDIPFKYDDSKNTFGDTSFDFSDIREDINKSYDDQESRFLANKCLQYAEEWATIASAGFSFKSANGREKCRLKRDCKNFIVSNLKQDKELQAGSVVITFLFFYVVLPVVLKFVLEKIFQKLFS